MRFGRTHLLPIAPHHHAPTAMPPGGGEYWPRNALRGYGLDGALAAVLLALLGWNWVTGAPEVGAVAVQQTAKLVVGARATTSWFDTVSADHRGTSLSLAGGSATSRITPSATNAGVEFFLDSALAGSYVYKIRFESTALGDDIPAGTLVATWTVGTSQRTASVPVDAAAVSALNRGGFTAVVPGTLLDGPKSIRVAYRQS